MPNCADAHLLARRPRPTLHTPQAATAAGTVNIAGCSATVEERKGNRRGARGPNGAGGGDRAGAGGGAGGRGGGGGGGARNSEGSHSIYIPSVDADATRDDIDAAFSSYGSIVR
jgi:hypothetical protein